VATISVQQSRFDGSSETYGLAWAKVPDTSRPSVAVRVPGGGEPWAVPSSRLRATFSEPVLGVDDGSFTVTQASTGHRAGAMVSYARSSRTATLRPVLPLAPGWYEATLSGVISDRAGNALRATTWKFRVRRGNPHAAASLDRAAKLRAGSHVGFQFDAEGNVTGSKRISPSTTRAYAVDERRTQPGMPGMWLQLGSGPLSGYWIRESPAAGVIGTVGLKRLAAGLRATLRAGTHVGRRFDGGSVRASRMYRPGSTVKVTADRRAVINGAWRLRISGGVLDGWWVTESRFAYLPGALQLTDLRSRRAAVRSGTRTAYRYSLTGKVLNAKTGSLSSARSISMAAWAIINGRPSFYATASPWAAHWLPESSGVHLP
jgi:hypothetical protein